MSIKYSITSKCSSSEDIMTRANKQSEQPGFAMPLGGGGFVSRLKKGIGYYVGYRGY